ALLYSGRLEADGPAHLECGVAIRIEPSAHGTAQPERVHRPRAEADRRGQRQQWQDHGEWATDRSLPAAAFCRRDRTVEQSGTRTVAKKPGQEQFRAALRIGLASAQ